MNDKDAKQLVEEIHDVKMLLILQLIGQGFKQGQIATMLGVSEATMSRMMPKGLSKALSKRKGAAAQLAVDANGAE